MSDRLRVVEAANVQQAEQVAQLADTLSTVTARIEDMLRRLEGVERRLDRSLYPPLPARSTPCSVAARICGQCVSCGDQLAAANALAAQDQFPW